MLLRAVLLQPGRGGVSQGLRQSDAAKVRLHIVLVAWIACVGINHPTLCAPSCATPLYRSRASAFIPSTLVGDGVCDCCGGEDEGGKCAEIPDCSALLA